MKDNKKIAEDSIVDFIDDEEYYETRRNKQQIENATWAMYIFAAISSISYIFYLLMNTESFDWVNFIPLLLHCLVFLDLFFYWTSWHLNSACGELF